MPHPSSLRSINSEQADDFNIRRSIMACPASETHNNRLQAPDTLFLTGERARPRDHASVRRVYRLVGSLREVASWNGNHTQLRAFGFRDVFRITHHLLEGRAIHLQVGIRYAGRQGEAASNEADHPEQIDDGAIRLRCQI